LIIFKNIKPIIIQELLFFNWSSIIDNYRYFWNIKYLIWKKVSIYRNNICFITNSISIFGKGICFVTNSISVFGNDLCNVTKGISVFGNDLCNVTNSISVFGNDLCSVTNVITVIFKTLSKLSYCNSKFGIYRLIVFCSIKFIVGLNKNSSFHFAALLMTILFKCVDY